MTFIHHGGRNIVGMIYHARAQCTVT